MNVPFSPAFAGMLLVAGLAGSLHCLGMCGPILLAFSQAVRPARVGAPPAVEFLAYHAGRIWTYALLGLIAGACGTRLRAGAALYGWQRPAGILAGVLVILAGLLLLGFLPARRLEAWLNGCGLARLRGAGWFATLAGSAGAGPRLLLGALMGFLPCGLVYAMLALAATLPTPAHAAAAMLVFGIGTVPSLTAVLLLGRSIAARVRRHGARLVAASLLVAGGVMLARALTSPAGHAGHAGQRVAAPGPAAEAPAAEPPAANAPAAQPRDATGP